MPRNLEIIRAHQKEKTLLSDKIINQDVGLSTFGFPHLSRQEILCDTKLSVEDA